MPLAIPQKTNTHGLPESFRNPSGQAEFNEWLHDNHLFADGFISKNMEQALDDIGTDLISYFARSYVKFPDQMKPVEERNENLGDKTPHLYHNMDRNGDNPAGIRQQDAERIAKQLERLNFAAKALVTRRSQLPPGLSEAEEQEIMNSSSGIDDIEAIINGTAKPPPPSPLIIFRRGKEVDVHAVEPGNYAHVSYDDIVQMTIPELCRLISKYKGEIECFLPEDIYIRSRLGAMEAIATYEMDAPETTGNYAVFRYDAPQQHVDTIADGIRRMLGPMSNEEFFESLDSESPTSKAHSAICKGASNVTKEAATSMVREQARSLCPEEGVLLGKLTRWIRSSDIPSNHLIKAEVSESALGPRILGFDLSKVNLQHRKTAEERIHALYEDLGIGEQDLDQQCIPNGLVLQDPAGTNRYEELTRGIDDINRGRPR